jgi:type II restriction enzyme
MQLEHAITDALRTGNALCKFISRNDVGATGGHQCGFYLPKAVWRMFSSHGPVKNVNHKTDVRIRWPGGVVTNSKVTWYGSGTRSEYRLTQFGRDFPWLAEYLVGSLLVLVPHSLENFSAYVLERDEEIEALQMALGIEMLGRWGVFMAGQPKTETEDACLERVFAGKLKALDNFPDGRWMGECAREALEVCAGDAGRFSADELLLKWIGAEYRLFRALEKKVSLPAISRPFKDIDTFISVAATVMNRRKSRAGHSLENHVEQLLARRGLPFDRQPRIDGNCKPDLLIPGKAAYEDPAFPMSRLIVAGMKTTCKDRWRQILNESKRIPEKHLITLQEAISANQLLEMREANVTLIVPKAFHKGYDTRTGIRLLSVEGFLDKVENLTQSVAA